VDDTLIIGLLVVVLLVVVAAVIAVVRFRLAPTNSVTEAPPGTLKARLARTRSALGGRLSSVFNRNRLDDADWSELEEILLAGDVGVATATAVVEAARSEKPDGGAAALDAVERALIGMLADEERSISLVGEPAVVLVVGVNGTGKTTSIAKLASRMHAQGHRVILAAADTYRAAADRQLRTWADRVGVEVVSGDEGGDPAAVAFNAVRRAGSEGYDVVIVDTAGRLHSKSNLMDELNKVARVLGREAGEVGEVLLVVDGTTGQNAIAQARAFTDTAGVTGIVLTKLDGTARGGIAFAVERELGIPVKFIGVGEGVEDLIPFDPAEFVEALLEP
jgi:fused signal recognition particle receptor